MAHYFPSRFTATTVCARMLAAGLKGRKNGASAGFYTYAGKTETVNPAVAALMPERGAAQAGMNAEAIAERLMGVMTGEAQRCLDEGVLKTADEVNLAMLLGTGFPATRGGLLGK
jgi:3-hydroxyacyl-CoA dehydrogenase/enoyl-CoA hydratase/3-hydroxybutyryl-CoA epimerase